MLLYWLCVSLRVICGPVGRVEFADTGVSGSRLRCVAQVWRSFSSSLPWRMRSPPVCGIRLVAFWTSRESSGLFGLMKARKRWPNWLIWSGVAFSAGKRSLVPEATPLSLWHARHWAFSNTG